MAEDLQDSSGHKDRNRLLRPVHFLTECLEKSLCPGIRALPETFLKIPDEPIPEQAALLPDSAVLPGKGVVQLCL